MKEDWVNIISAVFILQFDLTESSGALESHCSLIGTVFFQYFRPWPVSWDQVSKYFLSLCDLSRELLDNMVPDLTALIYAISCWGLVNRVVFFMKFPRLQGSYDTPGYLLGSIADSCSACLFYVWIFGVNGSPLRPVLCPRLEEIISHSSLLIFALEAIEI